MFRISPGFLIVPSIALWLFGTIEALETNSTFSNILIHTSTIGYLAGIFIWARNNRGEDSPVTFWKKSDPTFYPSGCLGRVFKIGAVSYLFIFTPLIIASNWLPYNIHHSERDWVNFQKIAIEQLELKSKLGDTLQFTDLGFSMTDSITTKGYRVTGNFGEGLIELVIDHQDSILSLSFEQK